MDTIHQIIASDPGNAIAYFVVGGAFLIAIIGIVSGTLTSIVRIRARERSRREIAAYIAEGSMSPAEGERLMAAGGKA